METTKIAHFDDNNGQLINVSSQMKIINKNFREKGVEHEIELFSYHDYKALCGAIAEGGKFDLLILDMFNDKTQENVGEYILNAINGEDKKTPTFIFTQATVRGHLIDFNKLYEKYQFIQGDLILKGSIEELAHRIESYILKVQINNDLFFIDPDDIFLQAEIIAVGKDNLNEILYQIKIAINYNGKFIITRMSSGYSGAVVFRLNYDNRSAILKISRDKKELENELEKAKSYYSYFPSNIRINIDHKKYFNEEVLAVLIEEVKEGLTLFSWLRNKNSNEEIENLFNDLFFRRGLKGHYKEQRTNIKEKFTYIFDKINPVRYSLIRTAMNELNPIVNKFSPININDMKNLLLHGSYENLDKNELVGDKYRKELILCHGDFHSNNILVQENRPVIIDTSNIGYDFWCIDICRLIVNLFITGFDNNSYNYFALARIKHYLELAQKIIHQDTIEPDKCNDGFIHAINWLTQNVNNIYNDLYSKWEFQLGLMKEFLQVSYRTSSIPPGKRALALIAAYQCMLISNEEKTTNEVD